MGVGDKPAVERAKCSNKPKITLLFYPLYTFGVKHPLSHMAVNNTLGFVNTIAQITSPRPEALGSIRYGRVLYLRIWASGAAFGVSECAGASKSSRLSSPLIGST
ncbi:hypothetical protein CPELA_09350 [Corynebacterium pelargi]|uniref:Uncharacterized protein n=1 Tax=Corynebacterium pelargi TaxID=1471400 RepID=A0A410WB00_9CORY|nr:hypothetical protein CPELA_09350 [Corynebacterium pelargi]